MNKQSLTNLLKDQKVLKLIDKYLSTEVTSSGIKTEERYKFYNKCLTKKRFILPVTGVQGSGKSTLLNAIAFSRSVLPIDAVETTSVPIEIVWGDPPREKASIRFLDGSEKSVIASDVELSPYVDKRYNPENEKKVDKIIIESDRDIFKNGLVLVDLPGTGSVTAANMRTTHSYLKESTGVIFMLRTVPPITNSESSFLSYQWNFTRNVIFVQNKWTDETNEEAKAGNEHNKYVLQEIAERNRINSNGNLNIHTVNAQKALEGVLNQDLNTIESSGLTDFLEVLSEISKKWPKIQRITITKTIESDLSEVRESVLNEIEVLSSDKKKIKRKIRRQQKRFDKYINEFRDKRVVAIEDLSNFNSKLNDLLTEWRILWRKKLRNNMRTKMRAGIVDGKQLENALIDEESIANDKVFADVQEEIFVFLDSLQIRFEATFDWKINITNDFCTVYKDEKKKFENLAPEVLGGAGAVGGMVGGAKGGAAIGAKIGIVGGPWGVAIGGAAGGVIGGLAGAWAGNKAREIAINKRAKNIEGEVFIAIDHFIDTTTENITSQIDSFGKHLIKGIDKWEKEQINKFKKELENVKENLDKNYDSRMMKKKNLFMDLELTNKILMQF